MTTTLAKQKCRFFLEKKLKNENQEKHIWREREGVYVRVLKTNTPNNPNNPREIDQAKDVALLSACTITLHHQPWSPFAEQSFVNCLSRSLSAINISGTKLDFGRDSKNDTGLNGKMRIPLWKVKKVNKTVFGRARWRPMIMTRANDQSSTPIPYILARNLWEHYIICLCIKYPR